MQLKKMLVGIAVFLLLVLGLMISQVQASEQVPALLQDIVGQINQIWIESNCDQEKFAEKFKQLGQKYDEKVKGGEYKTVNIPNLPPEYMSPKTKDMIQTHDITRGSENDFSDIFPNELLDNGKTGMPKALHFNRYLKLFGLKKLESNTHIIFWIHNASGHLEMCVIFWDSRVKGKITEKCFDLSDCNAMEKARSWVWKEVPVFLPVPGFEFNFSPEQKWQSRRILDDSGFEPNVSYNITEYMSTLSIGGLIIFLANLPLPQAKLAAMFLLLLQTNDVSIPTAKAYFDASDYDLWNIPQINPADSEDVEIGVNYNNFVSSATASSSGSKKKPELFVKELKFRNNKTKYYDDETIYVDGHAYNVGADVSGNIKKIAFRLYRFKGEKENGDTKEVGDENIKGENFGSGKTKHEEFSFGAPDSGNKYQIYAVIDAKNAVSESNEGNNRSSNLTFRVHKRPDIRVSNLVLSDGRIEFATDEIPNARATFTNSGGEPFQDVPVRWYLDGNHFADDNMRHWNIDHGKEKHEDVNLVQAMALGKHTLRVCADFPEDKHKSDNCKEIVFEVFLPEANSNVNVPSSPAPLWMPSPSPLVPISPPAPPPPPKVITITNPVGDKWRTDREYVIEWRTQNILSSSRVKIEYKLDGGDWKVIDGTVVNDGRKKWTPSASKDVGAVMRITLNDSPSVSAISGFKIDHKK